MSIEPEQDQRMANWMREAQAGSRESYALLLRELEAVLKGFLSSRLNSAETVEDVTQNILISIHTSLHTYNPQRPFAPWVYAIARNRLADFWRKHFRRCQMQVLTAVIEDTTSEPVQEDHHLKDEIAAALFKLPELQRRVVQFLKIDGYSIRETAKTLNISEASVKVLAHRGYKLLRKTFLENTYANK